jgi:hypothetical protein
MKVKLTFAEGLLGTAPNNKDVYKDFIASKATDAATTEDEIAAVGVDDVQQKGKTVFPRDEKGVSFVYDYQIKGFFKDACGMLARVKGTRSKELKAYKKVIDGIIFVAPRQIYLRLPEGTEIGECQRPLRGQTAQGERVALVYSDEAPAGTSIEFEISCLSDTVEPVVREWLDYGKLRGLGQWRNSGKGRFGWEEIE